MYVHVTHLKTVLVDKGSETIINKSIGVSGRSMKGLLLYEPYVAGAKDREKTFNPEITEVKVIVNGIPIKVYSQGMETRYRWEELFRRFEEENSAINATDFYAGDRFALFIDLRSMRDSAVSGSGLRLVNTKEGVQLVINGKASGSVNVKCDIFILSDVSSTSLTVSLKAHA